ncbi:MAG: hypothetical protein BAJATHORv1_60009 [Candidatus Thorarchaeota archaeon]|nr:MAG: hypothetical protein BAJATHORv1_60009 [Candidatus Thorarchaeota archaeon]
MKNWLIIQASKAKKFGSEKVVTMTLTKLNDLLMTSLLDIVGPEKSLQMVFEGGVQLGHEFMMELSAHLEPDVGRIPAYGEAAWIMFSGHKPTEQTLEEIEIDGKEAHLYTFTDDDSPWCRDISFPHKFCQFPAGAYQGAAQTWSMLTRDSEYNILSRETKCRAAGDNYCEFQVYFIPQEIDLTTVKETYPHLFEEISTGFSVY